MFEEPINDVIFYIVFIFVHCDISTDFNGMHVTSSNIFCFVSGTNTSGSSNSCSIAVLKIYTFNQLLQLSIKLNRI